jgi:hypothetical protein
MVVEIRPSFRIGIALGGPAARPLVIEEAVVHEGRGAAGTA